MKLLHDYILVEKFIKEDDEALIKIPDSVNPESEDLIYVKIIDAGHECEMLKEEGINIGDIVLVDNYHPDWSKDDRFIIRENYIQAVVVGD